MQTQLLCTFTNKTELKNTLQSIRETYHIVYNYIYVLQNKGNLEELFITYNIDTQYKPTSPLENTILVHRKKQSNTLYTINALNELVKEENGGVFILLGEGKHKIKKKAEQIACEKVIEIFDKL